MPPTMCKNRKSSYIFLRNGRIARMMMHDMVIVAYIILISFLLLLFTCEFAYPDSVPPIMDILRLVNQTSSTDCVEKGQHYVKNSFGMGKTNFGTYTQHMISSGSSTISHELPTVRICAYSLLPELLLPVQPIYGIR